MRLKLFLFLLVLVIHADSEVQGAVSYSRNIDVWSHDISHPAHQVSKPVPNPSLIRTLEPSSETDLPEITTELVKAPSKPYITPRINIPARNPIIENTTSTKRLDGSREQPISLSPVQNRPSFVRPPLQPRPIPKPQPLRPVSIPDYPTTTVSIEPNEEVEQTTTQRQIPDGSYTRPPFQFIHTQGPVSAVSIPEFTTSSIVAVEATTGGPIQTQSPIQPHIFNDEKVLSGYVCARADGYFGYPDKCDSFVECRNNLAISYNCPEGLHFNPSKVWPGYPCAYPSEVKCYINANLTVSFNVTTTTPDITENVDPLPPPINSNNGVVLIEYSCAQIDGYFGYPNECESFVECRKNLAVRYICPDGLLFNPNTIWPEYPCANPSEVQCDLIDPTIPLTTIVPDVTENKIETNDSNGIPDDTKLQVTTKLPEPSTYATYLDSTNNDMSIYLRPQPTRLPFRPKPNWEPISTVRPPPIRQTLVPRLTSTYRPPLTQKPLPVMTTPPNSDDVQILTDYSCANIDGYFGVSGECESFIECRKNFAVRYLCPDGLHFNPNSVWPQYPCAFSSEVQCGTNADPTVPVITSTLPPSPDVTEDIEESTSRTPFYPRPRPTRLPLRPEPNREHISTGRPPISQPNGHGTSVPWHTSTYRPPVTQKPLPLETPAPNPNGIDQPLPLHPPFVSNDGQVLTDYSCANIVGYFGVSDECESFIECRKNFAVMYSCPDGLHFNPNSVWPEYPCASSSEVQCGTIADPTVPVITSTLPPSPDVTEDIGESTSRTPFYPRPRPTRLPLRPEPNREHISTGRPPISQPNGHGTNVPWHTSTYRPPVTQKHLPPAPNPNGIDQPLPLHPPIIYGEILSGYSCARAYGYFGYPNECDSFVECKKNVAIKFFCQDGLHFNPNTIWPEYPCAYASEVQCKNNAIKPVPQPTADCPNRHGYFPMNDGECGRYIMCQEGLATIMNCPQGLVFNPDTSSCDWPENVPSCNPDVFRGFTCPVPTLYDNGEPSEEIMKFRYGESCNQYIACHGGHPRLLSCDPDLSFDIKVQACVASHNVQNCKA